jgi:hypothetical protein
MPGMSLKEAEKEDLEPPEISPQIANVSNKHQSSQAKNPLQVV